MPYSLHLQPWSHCIGYTFALVLTNATGLPIAGGGTNATTAANALINLFPAAGEVGYLVYCATFSSTCTSWALFAEIATGTKYLQETSAGAPSWTTPGGAISGLTTGFLVQGWQFYHGRQFPLR